MTFQEFEVLLNNLTKDGALSDNFGDSYYWEHWSIEKLDNGKYEVGFDIGSGSGWIPTNIEYKEVTIEELFKLFEAQDNLGELSMLSELCKHYESLEGTITKQESD
jgi:hypothetical protein